MSNYLIANIFWNQLYFPDLSRGWSSQEPPQGEPLGSVGVRIEVSHPDTPIVYLGWKFPSTLTFYKTVHHGADPTFRVRSNRDTFRNLLEQDIPQDILEAFEKKPEYTTSG